MAKRDPLKEAANNKRKQSKEWRWKSARKYAWKAQGIVNFTTNDYDVLYDLQNGRCAICELEIRKYGTGRVQNDACTDHDHSTGLVRGLLCRRCNLGIGFLNDSPETLEKALLYLKGE